MSAHGEVEVPEESRWRTSRACDGGACVGVARHGDFVVIGNTANPEAPASRFSIQEWDAFVAGVKLGDFDDLPPALISFLRAAPGSSGLAA